MKCLEFHDRLDAGDLASLERDARAHAAACPDCARALAQAAELEAALVADLGGAPAAVAPEFTARLMARVAEMPQSRPTAASFARAVVASFATPAIAVPAVAGAALLAFAATQGFDAARISHTVASAAEPLARLGEDLARPLPATGIAYEISVASLALAVLPLLAVATAAAWQLGQAIGGRSPRAL